VAGIRLTGAIIICVAMHQGGTYPPAHYEQHLYMIDQSALIADHMAVYVTSSTVSAI